MVQASNRISGSLVRAGTVDLPSDPGWSQPARHRSDAAGGGITRDDAPAGGGWAPAAWGELPGEGVLAGSTYTRPRDHRRFPTHDGDMGAGGGTPRTVVDSTDTVDTGDAPAPLYGPGGAAHGGISPQGVSMPWAYPALSRRRADGGVVTRDGTLDLGRRHIHTNDNHRQGLHMNRPTIRYVRSTTPVVERSSPYPGSAVGAPRTSPYNPIERARTMGPINPRGRRILRPFGQTDQVDIDEYPSNAAVYDPGVIGGDFVL
jgi:hypothetical protein